MNSRRPFARLHRELNSRHRAAINFRLHSRHRRSPPSLVALFFRRLLCCRLLRRRHLQPFRRHPRSRRRPHRSHLWHVQRRRLMSRRRSRRIQSTSRRPPSQNSNRKRRREAQRRRALRLSVEHLDAAHRVAIARPIRRQSRMPPSMMTTRIVDSPMKRKCKKKSTRPKSRGFFSAAIGESGRARARPVHEHCEKNQKFSGGKFPIRRT